MATEVLERPKSGTDQGDNGEAKKPSSDDPGKESGRSSAPDVIKVGGVKTTLGFDARRGNGPHETRESRDGKLRSLESSREISQELRDRFTDSLREDIKQLVDLRKNFGTKEEFTKMLKDSGHSYYIELFDRIVLEQPGTDNRSYDLNEDALKDFMSVDKGVVAAYRIKMRKLQEQALAVAMVMSISPDEPENNLPGKSDVPIGEGHGPLRRMGRKGKEWLYRERTKNGRPKIYLDKNGKLVLAIGGANAVGAGIGAGVGAVVGMGVPGAIAGAGIGALGTEGVLALIHAAKKGEYEKTEVSGKALKTLLGDKDSKNPKMRGPNRPQIEWMKSFYNIDPEQFRVNDDDEIERLNIVGDTGMDLAKDLMDKLRGESKLIQDFQEDNTVRPELRRPMDISWIFEETKNRPRQNTPDEKAIMDEFKADFGGIQDMYGNHVARWVLVRDERVTVPRETVTATTARKANYDVDALFHFDANVALPRGTWIPSYRNPATGAQEGGRPATAGETVPVAIDIESRPFDRGEALPIGTIIPAHRDSSNKYVAERRVTTTTETATHRFVSPGCRIEDGEDIPAGTVLEQHSAPVFDENGKQKKIKDENPNFDWKKLDVVGNAERWMAAEEVVLNRYVNEVFQSLVDGKTDHRMKVWERLHKSREGHASGKMVQEKQKRLTEEGEAIGKDKDTLKAESSSLDTFQTKIAEKRKALAKLKGDADAVVRGIKVDGKRTTNLDDIQEALQNALGKKDKTDTTTVTIGGQTIGSIEREYKELDKEIDKQVKKYIDRHVEPAASAVSAAETSLAGATNTQDYNIKSRLLAEARQKEASERSKASEFERGLREGDRFKNRTARIEARRKLLQDALDKISQNEDALEGARAVLTSNETEGREDAGLAIEGMKTARETIAATWRIPGANTDRELASKTYDQIVALINTENASDPTKGWPADANLLAENRLMVLHAMAEAKARLVEVQLRSPNPDLGALTNPPYNFTELDLYALNADEIYDAIPSTLPRDLARIDKAKKDATKRLTARQTALNNVILTVEKRASKNAEDLEKVVEKGISTPENDAIERAMERYPEITEAFMDHMPQQADRNKLFAYTETIGGTPPTVVSSRLDEDEAFENITDLIFKHTEDYNASYKDAPAGPDAARARNLQVLNKSELRSAIIRHFRLRAIGPNLEDALRAVRTMDRAKLANFFANELVLEHFVNKIP